jgi:two-component system response regulator
MDNVVTNKPLTTEILLVDDNPYDAELAIRVLKKYNLANQLVWVKDGAEALEFIFGSVDDPMLPINQKPRLILLDLKLPKINGHQVLARLKNDPRTRTLPVVMLTSSKEEADIECSYKSGVNSYIVKPVNFKNFTEAVRQLGLYWMLLNEPPEAR